MRGECGIPTARIVIRFMNPISTYRERLLQVRRDFELYPDRVDIRARWSLKGRFDSSVDLSGLDPKYRSFYIRNKLFKPAIVVLICGAAILFFSGDLDKLRAMSPLPVLGSAVALVGLALSWLTSRRIRFVQFQARHDRAGLDIACAGPDKDSFSQFVSQVQKRIRKRAVSG